MTRIDERPGQPGVNSLQDLGDKFVDDSMAERMANLRQRVEAEARQSREVRACSICYQPMERGGCPEHGVPAEDRGQWLIARMQGG